ncbi:hypothetical protein PI126_g19102 [Phytophthora idaei]|nr:hypothetical protein PI126_g19102 [Phytophthora idaei]
MVQAGPLGEKDDTSLKTAFFLMIIAMLHYPLAVFMFWKHLQEQKTNKELDDDQTTFVLEASDSQGGSRAYMSPDSGRSSEGEQSRTSYVKYSDEKSGATKNGMEHDGFFVF